MTPPTNNLNQWIYEHIFNCVPPAPFVAPAYSTDLNLAFEALWKSLPWKRGTGLFLLDGHHFINPCGSNDVFKWESVTFDRTPASLAAAICRAIREEKTR